MPYNIIASPPVEVLDEGISVLEGARALDFVGGGVDVTALGETAIIDIDGSAGGIIVNWEGTTTNATPTEIFIDGVASSRYTISANTSQSFNILLNAYDSVGDIVSSFTFRGAIKRDGSNSTVIVGEVNKVRDSKDVGSSLDADVSADDTNEALIITVTGDAVNTVAWHATARITKT